MPTVLLTGGTGMIGSELQQFLLKKNYSIIVLVRKDASENKVQHENISYSKWNVEKGEIDNTVVAQADYIIHLAGANVVDKRWTKDRKKILVESRTNSSALIIKALRETNNNVKAVLSASAIGFYGPDNIQSKKNGFKEDDKPYNDFLSKTCVLWEDSIKPVTELNKRLCIFRFGVVFSKTGGALQELKKPLHFGIAGILSNGKQVMSWIHIDDLCRALLYAIEHNEMHGTYNLVAPKPSTNKHLTLELANAIKGKKFIAMHVPSFVLKLMLGEASTEVLKSTTVNDEKITKAGFTFLYPSVEAAFENLFKKS